MCKKEYVVYFGLGFLPDENAIAVRAQSMRLMINECGYKPCLIGIDASVVLGTYEKKLEDESVEYRITYSFSALDKIKEVLSIHRTIAKILSDIGIQNIKAFIMQDNQFLPMWLIKKHLKKYNIDFIPDIMDWMVFSRDKTIFRNIFKPLDTVLRMRLLYKCCNKRILISHEFEQYFSKDSGFNVVIPPVFFDNKRNKCEDKKISKSTKTIKIFFAGDPGKHFKKERLDWIIQALYELKSNIEISIVGVSKTDAFRNNPSIVKYCTDRIHFLGKLNREKCLSLLSKSDFTIVIRTKSKLSKFGFSSKIAESLYFGIPVIATDVGDNKIYIKNNKNGYICSPNFDSVKLLLSEIEQLKEEEINSLKSNASAKNLFDAKDYVPLMDRFLRW